MEQPHGRLKAVGRVSIAVIVIIIIVVAAGVGIYYTSIASTASTSSSPPVSTTSSSSYSSSSATSSTSSATSSTSSSASSVGFNNGTLVMEDTLWPEGDLNQLMAGEGIPFPDWSLDAVYQSLVYVNESKVYATGAIQYLPGLAQNWTISPDGTTYTFNLRPGINFSNGDPFNAYAVWAMMYTLYYLSGNSSAWMVSYNVYDMSPVNFGPSTISLLTQSGLSNPNPALLKIMENSTWPIYVTGPNQIVFRLAHPFLYFLGLMIVFVGTVFDMQYVLNHGGPGTPASLNTYFNTNAIPGTGPYMVNGFSENSYISYTQNPAYWGKNLTAQQLTGNEFLDPGHVKNVIIYTKTDDIARYTDLSTGKAQIVDIASANWPTIISNPSTYSYYKVPKYNSLYDPVSINTELYPTNITDVRQAIVHAINYTDLIDKAFAGQGQELVAPEYTMYGQYYNPANLTPYQYNLTLAKQYLAEAGFPGGKGLPPITYYMPSSWHAGVVQGDVIQADLAQIGITVNINLAGSLSDYQANFGSYAYNLNNTASEGHITVCGGFTWGPSELTPADAFTDFLSNRSTWGNTAIYSNPVVEKAVNAFLTSNNVTYIQSQVKQAEIQIHNDAPLITIELGLWYGDGSLVWKNGVIKSFLVDPLTTGEDTMPIFNTVTFG